MSTIINTNVTALNSHRSMKIVGETTQKASEKLSSGLRINKAGDDAAGLAISEKMRSQIRGLNQASRNSQDGISLIQTAEGALQETEDMLQRMRELVVQASNDSNEQSDRDKIALELDELSKEISATAEKTEFNTKKLIDGSWEKSQLYFQVGANEGQSIEFNIAGMDSTRLGVDIGEIGDVVRGNIPNAGGVKVGVDGTVTSELTKQVNVTNNPISFTLGDTEPMRILNDVVNRGASFAKNAIDVAVNALGGASFGTAASANAAVISAIGSSLKNNLVTLGVASATASGLASTLAAELGGIASSLFVSAVYNATVLEDAFNKNGNVLNAISDITAQLMTTGIEAAASYVNVNISASAATTFKTDASAAVNTFKTGVTTASGSYATGVGAASTKYTSMVTSLLAAFGSNVTVFAALGGAANVNSYVDSVLTPFANDLKAHVGSTAYNAFETALKSYVSTNFATFKAVSAGSVKALMEGTTANGFKAELDKLIVAYTANYAAEMETSINTAFGNAISAIGTAAQAAAGKVVSDAFTFDGFGNVTINKDLFDSGGVFLGIDVAKNAAGSAIDTTVSVDALKGKAFADANGNIYRFSEDGKSYSKSNNTIDTIAASNAQITAAGIIGVNETTLNDGITKNYENIELADGTKLSISVTASGITKLSVEEDTYDLNGKLITAGEVKDANFLTKNGELIKVDSAGNVSIAVRGDVTFENDAFRVAPEKIVDTSNIAGTYRSVNGGAFTLSKDGAITNSQSIQLKDINGNAVGGLGETLEASDLKNVEMLTDKGLIKFSSDGKSFTLDTTITANNSAPNSTYYVGDGGSLKIENGKVTNMTSTLTDTKGNEITSLDDAKGKSFKLEDGRTLNIRADGYATFDDPKTATRRNDLAEEANKKYIAELNALGEDPSIGKVISGLVVKIDAAIETVSAQRAQLGAYQNRMEHTIKNLDTSSENLSAAESRIRDTDMAKEMMNFTKSNVLSQAAMSMLAQANQAPNNVLSLLR